MGQEVLVDNHYCYDRNGNCTERQQPGGTTRYTYDSVNQLTQIEYPTYTEQLYYDKAGNRSRRITDGTQEEYRYDPANHLTEYTRGGETTTFTYDKTGNLTADDRARYTYDLFNRAEKVETFDGHIQINHYDAEGLRSGIEEDGRLVQFIFRDQEVVTQLEEEKGMIRYIRGYDLIASDADSARTYYHYASDELGSITHVVAGEDIFNRYEYDAWGNLTLCEETVENRFKFNSQQYDPISQQYYLRARYYNPVIGRFTQEDTYRGDGLNLYAYCRNNPVYYADPSGHMSKCMKDALQRVMERDGVTQEQMDSDPDLRLRLMADASNIVKEQKRQQREQGNNSSENEIPALPGPGPTLALPGPVLDTSDNRIEGPNQEVPNGHNRIADVNDANTRRPDYYVTPAGDIIPANKTEFEYNISMMNDEGGEYVGETSRGPVRIRIEDPHPLDEHFNGDWTSDHFVEHMHIEHRRNGSSGQWGKGWNNKVSLPMSWIREDD